MASIREYAMLLLLADYLIFVIITRIAKSSFLGKQYFLLSMFEIHQSVAVWI